MRASDVMSRNVVTAGPGATVGEIVGLLLDRHISAVPIVAADGSLVGIVSEGDIMRRHEIGTEKRSSWWLRLLTTSEDSARDYVKAHAHKAEDVMTRGVISVAPDTPLDEIATTLERNHIKRVPVVESGKLVGIVSRADLIRALAAHPSALPTPSTDDASLREAVVAALRKDTGARLEFLNVIVTDGVVHLWGSTRSEVEKKAVRIAAEGVAGTDKVVDHVGVLTHMVRATMYAE